MGKVLPRINLLRGYIECGFFDEILPTGEPWKKWHSERKKMEESSGYQGVLSWAKEQWQNRLSLPSEETKREDHTDYLWFLSWIGFLEITLGKTEEGLKDLKEAHVSFVSWRICV